MKCYNCGKASVRGDDVRYCGDCGARLVQECPYCKTENPYSSTECIDSECKKVFLRCPTCNILYKLGQEFCEECGRLLYAGTIFSSYGVNAERSNCAAVASASMDKKPDDIGAQISDIALNITDENVYAYFWKKHGGESAVLCCYDLKTSRDVWGNGDVSVESIGVSEILYFDIQPPYLVTCISDKQIIVNYLTDGRIVKRINNISGQNFQICIEKRKMFIMYYFDKKAHIAVCDDVNLSNNPRIIKSYPMLEQKASVQATPLTDGPNTYFADYDGKIQKVSEDDTVRTISGETGSVLHMALDADKKTLVFLLKKSGSNICELSKISVEAENAPITIANDLQVEQPGFVLHKDMIVVCERTNTGFSFRHYPLTSIKGSSFKDEILHVNQANNDNLEVIKYYAIDRNGVLGLVILAKSINSPRFLAVYGANFIGKILSAPIKRDLPSKDFCVLSVGEKILVVDKKSGSISLHQADIGPKGEYTIKELEKL
ncbi:hypothetical protein AGMMS49975_16310 [Clostridia bacterium]|nr:hypothetical protein AGMMS49975_16310 [Clostridia bacterium]